MPTTSTGMPCHATTVDQHQYDHEPTGLPMMKLVDIVTDMADYVPPEEWESCSAEDRRHAADDLRTLHEARVALASLRADRREAVEEAVEAAGCIDFTDIAPAIRRAIEETEES